MDMIYTHNKSRLGLLRRGMRPSNMPLSRLLPESWNHLPGTVNISCKCVNSPFNLKNLIYEKEEKNRIFFLYEGLIKTFPSKRFIDGFWKKVGEIVPDELKELTWDETGILPRNTPIFGDEDTTNMTDEIHGSIGFFVPVYRDEIDTLRKTVNKVANNMAVHGYCLTDVDEMEHALKDEIAVVRVQFEAKFPADRFRFAPTLYHVAPLKYLNKIRKNGLVPKSKSSEFEYEDRVYLFNNMPLGGVLQYGEYKASQAGDSGFCLFSIDYGKLSSLETFKDGRLKFYVDNAFDNNNGMAQALFTYGNIPLSVMDNKFKIYHLADMNNPETRHLKD